MASLIYARQYKHAKWGFISVEIRNNAIDVDALWLPFQRWVWKISKAHSRKSLEWSSSHTDTEFLVLFKEIKIKYEELHPLNGNVCVLFCFFFMWEQCGHGRVKPTAAPQNETSPVLISYLRTKSGGVSGGSLRLIASLKSHKAVLTLTGCQSITARPLLMVAETSRGSKLQGPGGRGRVEKKKKVHVKPSCRLLSWDANTPEAAELDPDPVAD